MKPSSKRLDQTLSLIAGFYDRSKVGCEGSEGYRKSTDLDKFIRCARELKALRLIDRQTTNFLDLGCADGRVNVLMSYFVHKSIGIEIDPDILSDYRSHASQLDLLLRENQLDAAPGNVFVFTGNSLENETFGRIQTSTGVGFKDVDIFYTYITLHDAFAEKIAAEAKNDALYLVYGFNKILPHYTGLELLLPDVASQGIAILYKKTG